MVNLNQLILNGNIMIKFKPYDPNNLPKYITDGHPFIGRWPDPLHLALTHDKTSKYDARCAEYRIIYMGQFGDLFPYDSLGYQLIDQDDPSRFVKFSNPWEYAELF